MHIPTAKNKNVYAFHMTRKYEENEKPSEHPETATIARETANSLLLFHKPAANTENHKANIANVILKLRSSTW